MSSIFYIFCMPTHPSFCKISFFADFLLFCPICNCSEPSRFSCKSVNHACMNEHFYMEIYLADTPHRRNVQHFGGGSEPLPRFKDKCRNAKNPRSAYLRGFCESYLSKFYRIEFYARSHCRSQRYAAQVLTFQCCRFCFINCLNKRLEVVG